VVARYLGGRTTFVGSRTMNVEPRPTSLTTSMPPPCSRTILRAVTRLEQSFRDFARHQIDGFFVEAVDDFGGGGLSSLDFREHASSSLVVCWRF
jgi:hypothetical protein